MPIFKINISLALSNRFFFFFFSVRQITASLQIRHDFFFFSCVPEMGKINRQPFSNICLCQEKKYAFLHS